MIPRKQRGVAAGTVRLVTRVLPAGPVRSRYQQEFLADVHGLSRTQRIRYTFGLLGTALALRAAVTALTPAGPTVPVIPRRSTPLRCLIHHRWRIHTNPDGVPYGRCERCGQDRFDGVDRLTDTGKTSANLAANIIGRPG